MIEMGEAALSAAMSELASEKQAAIDQALDVVAGRARGRSALEVEALLQAELIRRGVEPDTDTATIAQQIVAAVESRG